MLKQVLQTINNILIALERRNRQSKWINRSLFFFNWITIIQVPYDVLVQHRHKSNLTLFLWAALCIYTYHWYFSCEFPWQTKKDKSDDQTDTRD